MTGSEERLVLDVPYAEKDDAKERGARWDPKARTWYAPPGSAREAFARWLPRPLPGGPFYPARLILFPTACWRCGSDTTAIGGALVETSPELGDVWDDLIPDDCAFLSFHTIAEAVVRLIPAGQLARHEVGPLKRRSTTTAGESYIGNGCRQCGAPIGSRLLQEELVAAGEPFDSYPSIPLSLPEDLWAA